VFRRDPPEDHLHVGCTRRVDLLLLLPRQLDRAVASRVRADPGVVEGHRAGVAELRAEDPTLTQAQVAEVLELSERTVRKYWRDEADEGQENLLGRWVNRKPNGTGSKTGRSTT
jgi:hypothetical protein